MVKQVEFSGEVIIRGRNGCLVASHSEPGAWHVVKTVGGVTECDCKGFTRYGRCRHVNAVVAFERAHPVKKVAPSTVAHDRDTAPLAGPAIDPPLFPPSKPWAPKRDLTFEQLFGAA